MIRSVGSADLGGRITSLSPDPSLFNEEPNVQSQVGYVTTDLMIRAMEAAGPDLTTEKMLAELEKVKDFVDPFGGPNLSFGPDKHQGSDSIYLSQVIDGKWQVVQKNLPY